MTVVAPESDWPAVPDDSTSAEWPRASAASRLALVTGATGFVATALVPRLHAAGWRVRAALRSPAEGIWDEAAIVGDLAHGPDWRAALAGVDCVFHLAARVHRLRDEAVDPAAAYHAVNVAASEALAVAARSAGVRRLVFLSSAKVCGEATSPGRPFSDASVAAPRDDYARSKFEAEQRIVAAGIEAVILRPPLVYGPGVGANFLRLLRLVDRGLWLPLGAIGNRRSLIYVGNLADALLRAAEHRALAGGRYLVCDGPARSTTALLQALAAALGRPPRLLPAPSALLRLAAGLFGRSAEAARVLDSFELDGDGFCEHAHWRPPWSLQQGLAQTVAWYRATQPVREG